MKFFRRLIAVLAAVAVIAGLAYYANSRKDSKRGTVTLWYVKDSVLAEGLRELARSYNSSFSRKTLPVETIGFESERELAEAFQTGSPDLVVCSHYSAFNLFERSKLTDIGSALTDPPMYARTVTSRSGSIGQSFFPVGFSLPVLIANSRLVPRLPASDLTAFLETASEYSSLNGRAYFACESYADIYYTELLRQGRDFDADPDKLDKQYLELYNRLASAAFDGSMAIVGKDCAKYTAEGVLPCAVVSSSQLRTLDLSKLTVQDLPSLEGAINGDTMGEAFGLAVTAGGCRSIADIAAFVDWLFSDNRSIKLAEDNCLAPAEGLVGSTGGSVFADIAANKIISLPAPASEYYYGRDGFNESFVKALQPLLP